MVAVEPVLVTQSTPANRLGKDSLKVRLVDVLPN